ncbi:hypothetical protein GBA52_006312 [Prunus armeniaca]|nr:hypothetical protein GBA52_006312 [Prunus armeniaca]
MLISVYAHNGYVPLKYPPESWSAFSQMSADVAGHYWRLVLPFASSFLDQLSQKRLRLILIWAICICTQKEVGFEDWTVVERGIKSIYQKKEDLNLYPANLILVSSTASMPSATSPRWQEKASGFFSTSGVKLKEAGQSAGTFVEEVTKDAKVNVTDMAERVGSMFKSRWALLQQPSTRHAVQERLITAAATTGTLFRKGLSETKDKVSVGKIKVEEVAKKTAQKSKTILSDIERWQKGVASTDVFGVPIEVTVQRQQSSRPIPHILVKCADYLILSGLNTPYLFKGEGDKKVIQQLVSLYNQDSNASLPEGINPIDVAALIKCYLATLPEPLTTFELYNEIKGARSSIHAMRNMLRRLPTMDTQSLAMEMAPVLIWQKGRTPDLYRKYWTEPSKGPSKKNLDPEPTYSAWDMLSDEDDAVDDSIPLDDGVPIDFGAIEVVQCLMGHHNAIFTDANETIWR